MSEAHPTDRQVLGRLAHLAGAVLARPFQPQPNVAAALDLLGVDIAVARRCPGADALIGSFEGILFAAVQMIAAGGTATTEELYRCQVIASHALPMVQKHFGDAVVADIERAQAARAC